MYATHASLLNTTELSLSLCDVTSCVCDVMAVFYLCLTVTHEYTLSFNIVTVFYIIRMHTYIRILIVCLVHIHIICLFAY